jgi:hypothetical protein
MWVVPLATKPWATSLPSRRKQGRLGLFRPHFSMGQITSRPQIKIIGAAIPEASGRHAPPAAGPTLDPTLAYY